MNVQVVGDLLIAAQQCWALEDVETWLRLIEQVLKDHGCAFAILDTRQGLAIASAPRRRLVEGLRHQPLNLCVVLGSSLTSRALVMLAARALTLLRKRPANLRFATSMEEAMQLIAAERLRVLSAREGTPG